MVLLPHQAHPRTYRTARAHRRLQNQNLPHRCNYVAHVVWSFVLVYACCCLGCHVSCRAQKVALPDSPMGQPPTSPAIAGPTWSDFRKLYSDVMSIAFCMDPRSRQVAWMRLDSEKRIAKLSDRLKHETDQDFIEFTNQKD